MTVENYLLLIVIVFLVATIYMICTNSMSDKERDEMLNDEEMWP